MSMNPPFPDLAAWEVYCENCKAFRAVRRAISKDAEGHREYHELVCSSCTGILLTCQQRGSRVD